MKRNILLVADGDIESDLQVIDAASRGRRGVRRARADSRPSQILRRRFNNVDAVVVDLDKHGHTLSIVEALGCNENTPPVVVISDAEMARVAYAHGAAACVTRPFTADRLAAVIDDVCSHGQSAGIAHPAEVVSFGAQKSSLHQLPD